jgi:hypothetical protein
MRVARLLAIEEDNGAYVVPYVDSISNAERKGEYLILGRGSISCSETNGLNVCGAQCDCCGRHYDDENEGGYLEGRGESVCDSCYSENTFYCDRYQETREGDSSDYVTMADGDTWCNEAFEQYGAECDATGENLPADQCVTLEDGTVWSKEYFAKHGYQCQGCRCLFANGDDCGNGCDPEAVEHAMPRLQGRDEHPDQIEMPLVPPQSLAVPRGLKVGDRVRVLSGGYAGQVPDGAIADITCVYGPGFEVDGWYFTRKELEFVSSPVLELEAA